MRFWIYYAHVRIVFWWYGFPIAPYEAINDNKRPTPTEPDT